MSEELKPCPFCGEVPLIDKELVQCGTLKCPEISIMNPQAWNRRAYKSVVTADDIKAIAQAVEKRDISKAEKNYAAFEQAYAEFLNITQGQTLSRIDVFMFGWSACQRYASMSSDSEDKS